MAIIEQDVINLHQNDDYPPVLDITEGASLRLQGMMKERNLEGYALRVFVSGGGCSGLQYGMTFDNEERMGDTIWNAYGLQVMVDPISARYLTGATISYQQDNMLAGAFKIDNPNAVSSCGCGHSFRSKEQQGADEGYDDYNSGGGCGCSH
ncbi:MAG: iron-sulfur cluster assembly accessory protein [Chloroflexi bacterium]|nr:iron-sulfur cluster assembly accessory protein [Chloroflexota bacterium]